MLDELRAELKAHRDSVDRKVNVLLQGVAALIRIHQTKDNAMSIHDDLLAAAQSLDASADKAIAAVQASDGTMSDVLAQLQATQAKLDSVAEVATPVEQPAA